MQYLFNSILTFDSSTDPKKVLSRHTHTDLHYSCHEDLIIKEKTCCQETSCHFYELYTSLAVFNILQEGN